MLLRYGEIFASAQNPAFWRSPYTFTGKEFDAESGLHYFGARYYLSSLGVWLSTDPLADHFANMSPYAYAANNPALFTDRWGLAPDPPAWWSQFHTQLNSALQAIQEANGEVLTAFSDVVVEISANQIPKQEKASKVQQSNFLRNKHVKITFDRGANNEVNPRLVKYFDEIIKKAAGKGIISINISSTTNHPSNSSKSAHTKANGARAFDINYVNNIHVGLNNQFAKDLQQIIQSTPGWRENYGPFIIQKMHNGVAIPAPWARDLPKGHYDHIHVSIPQ